MTHFCCEELVLIFPGVPVVLKQRAATESKLVCSWSRHILTLVTATNNDNNIISFVIHCVSLYSGQSFAHKSDVYTWILTQNQHSKNIGSDKKNTSDSYGSKEEENYGQTRKHSYGTKQTTRQCPIIMAQNGQTTRKHQILTAYG